MKGRDILIVEDENIVALDMRMRLESMGYRVLDIVDTGNAALERVAALEPDLVLMDIKLKGDQDGIDAAEQLRERMEVPVIFVTAFTDERTLERAKRASPYGYIVKPFHERELRIAIELALYKHQYELSIRRARDIAEEANRVKGEFLANMSHELKTPLNSVIGFTELAMSVAKEPEQLEHLAMALSSARSLLTLIQSILDFARMEAGKLSAVPAPFSLDALLGECADSLAMAAFSKGLEVSLGRDPAIPDALVGDGSLLRHILLNLLDNAVKFTDRGRIRLAASLYEAPAGIGSWPTIAFEVSDTGIGMPKDRIGLAFARFTQLDASKTRKAGGTGLGLAIVSKSVALMGGELAVESEEGRGTRFLLRIPFDAGDAEQPAPSHRARQWGGEAVLAGFDDEAYADANLVLRRFGLASRRVDDLGDIDSLGEGPIIADERSLPGSDELVGLESRLVVCTRFGGATRSRLEGKPAIAFTTLPLRAEGLRAALAALPGTPAAGERRKSADRLGPEARLPRPSARETEGGLARLADILDSFVDAGGFAAAERVAKEYQAELSAAGDSPGAKLAFSALLHARKGDAEGLRAAAARMRAAAQQQSLIAGPASGDSPLPRESKLEDA